MASSGNFGTWNTLADYSSGTTFSNGNCTTAISQQNQYRACLGPAIPDSGKWYIEFFIDHQSAGFPSLVGLLDRTANSSLSSGNYLSNAGSFHIEPMTGKLYSESTTGTSYTGNSGSPAAIGDSDAKVGIAIDRDANKLWFAVNNTWINVGSGVGDPANGNNPAVSSIEENLSISHGIRQATGTSKVVINCGQDSTFGGLETAGGNADGNGFGDFFYAPPSGFLALSSANLPISDDIDPAQTDNDYPGKQMNVLTYTGNGSTRSITGLGFKPDCIFLKARNYASVQQVYDSTRGGTKQLYPSQPGAEATYSYLITSFDNDGWSMGNGDTDINYSSRTFVTWCFRANGGVTSSNTDGSITSTVQANTKAGFSIVSYTGNATNGATFGHGLSAKPSLVFIKNRDASQKWGVWHQSMTQDDNKIMFLDTNAALTTEGTQRWDVSAISDSVFGLGSHPEINGSSANYISYLWHDVEGYSKFGKFEGNANNDGPFIYTGFRPRFLFIKGMDTTSPWTLYDGERLGYNDPPDSPAQQFWDEALTDHTSYGLDIYSSGFKLRTSNATVNASGTWLFGAWGDVPFKYNNTF